MRVGILSDCKVPTRPVGGHGLGRVAIDLARGLKARGHDVILYGADGSEWDGEVVTDQDEFTRATRLYQHFRQRDRYECDVFVDVSPKHQLSEIDRHAPVVNYLMDFSCKYSPPNAAIANEGLRWRAENAAVVPIGIDVDAIPFVRSRIFARGNYAAYAAKIHRNKGYDLAIAVCAMAGIALEMVGVNFANELLLHHREELKGDAFYKWLGGAVVHVAPYRRDAGSRVALEAAACGVPTITFDRTATQYHVQHGLSGWVVRDVSEMAEAIGDIGALMRVIDRPTMREWVQSAHGLDVMVVGIERLIARIMDGERW